MMTMPLMLLGAFALGIAVVGTLNRRRAPAPVRGRSSGDGGAYPVWAHSGDASSGGVDCDPGSADCGASDGGGSGGE
jgi:hypothetical protein